MSLLLFFAESPTPLVLEDGPVAVAVGIPAHGFTSDILAFADAVTVAVGVPAHALVAGPVAARVGVSIGTATLVEGPRPVPVGVNVSTATLVAGPTPVTVGVGIPTHTFYGGAYALGIAVGVPAVSFDQSFLVTPVALGWRIPTQSLTPPPPVTLTVAGVARDARRAGFQLNEALNHEADSVSFRTDDFTPAVGNTVAIEISGDLVFSGHIVNVRRVTELRTRTRITYDVDAIDNGWLLDRRLVNAQYTAIDRKSVV